jgi:hypothetical protein
MLPVPSHQAAFTQVVEKDLSSSPSPSASSSPSSFCVDDHVLQPFFERRRSSFTTISVTNIIESVILLHRNRSTTPPTHTAPDSLIYLEQSYNTSDAGSDSLGSHSIMLLWAQVHILCCDHSSLMESHWQRALFCFLDRRFSLESCNCGENM